MDHGVYANSGSLFMNSARKTQNTVGSSEQRQGGTCHLFNDVTCINFQFPML